MLLPEDDPDLPFEDVAALRKSLERLRTQQEASCALRGHRWAPVWLYGQDFVKPFGTCAWFLRGWRCLRCRERE